MLKIRFTENNDFMMRKKENLIYNLKKNSEEFYKFIAENVVQHGNTSLKFKKLFINKKTF